MIHALWMRDDKSPLVLPASIPLDDSAVLTELEKHLPDSWKPIIDSDIDGPGSTSVGLDRVQPNLGRYSASRRVARAIFVGSAPRSGGANKGVEVQRIRLGCAIPGETVATFGDALNRLAERSTYLYQEGPRYWYGVQPSVTRRAQELADRYRLSHREELHARLVQRLRLDRDRGSFAAVHVAPTSSGDVPDEPEVRLVVIHPTQLHVRGSEVSPALEAAKELLERRGTAARELRNTLVFLAADQRGADELEQAMAEAVAWAEVDDAPHVGRPAEHSVAEVALAGDHHGYSVLDGGGYHLVVAAAAAGLDHRGDQLQRLVGDRRGDENIGLGVVHQLGGVAGARPTGRSWRRSRRRPTSGRPRRPGCRLLDGAGHRPPRMGWRAG